MSNNGPILSVEGLKTYFLNGHRTIKAVDGVSFEVARGETLAIVGESGSGKTVTGLSLMGLIGSAKIEAGRIIFDGVDIAKLPIDQLRKIRGKRIAMIFQDPMTSLNPFLTIGGQMMEVTRLHLGHSRGEAREHAVKMLEMVGISDAETRLNGYPHELSGGMRQRVVIAMALSCKPELIIADEPTTALDVTIQAQILELVKDLQTKLGTSVILIAHDLGVVSGTTDKVVVMYAGRVFEQAPTVELFERPANPYTQGLLRSMPDPAHETGTELFQIPGAPPDFSDLPSGCPFAPRCHRAAEICVDEFPPFVAVTDDHHSLCHFADVVFGESDGVSEIQP